MPVLGQSAVITEWLVTSYDILGLFCSELVALLYQKARRRCGGVHGSSRDAASHHGRRLLLPCRQLPLRPAPLIDDPVLWQAHLWLFLPPPPLGGPPGPGCSAKSQYAPADFCSAGHRGHVVDQRELLQVTMLQE